MSVTLDQAFAEATRQADGPSAAVLRQEARRWARARHPGIAELVDLTDTGGSVSVTIRQPAGPPLADIELSGAEIAGVLAVIATTVADLRDIGVTVGELHPEAIRLEPDGRPVLCDLSDGRLLEGQHKPWPAGLDAYADVASLGRLTKALTAGLDPSDREGEALATLAVMVQERDAARREHRLRTLVDRVRSPRPRTARSFADAVVARVPTACLPTGASSTANATAQPSGTSAPEPVHIPWIGGLGTIVLLATAWWWFAPASPRRPSVSGVTTSRFEAPAAVADRRPGGPSTTSRPPSDLTIGFAAGVLRKGDRSYQLSEEGDVAASGRWTCGPDRTIALLRPSTGEIFVFATWPEARASITARPVGRVSGARTLVRVPDGACDALSVVGPGSSTMTLHPSTT